ncbi:MAG: hypothetical protein ABID35_06390 [Candidatus Margulisiibacteriota bacterium]
MPVACRTHLRRFSQQAAGNVVQLGTYFRGPHALANAAVDFRNCSPQDVGRFIGAVRHQGPLQDNVIGLFNNGTVPIATTSPQPSLAQLRIAAYRKAKDCYYSSDFSEHYFDFCIREKINTGRSCKMNLTEEELYRAILEINANKLKYLAGDELLDCVLKFKAQERIIQEKALRGQFIFFGNQEDLTLSARLLTYALQSQHVSHERKLTLALMILSSHLFRNNKGTSSFSDRFAYPKDLNQDHLIPVLNKELKRKGANPIGSRLTKPSEIKHRYQKNLRAAEIARLEEEARQAEMARRRPKRTEFVSLLRSQEAKLIEEARLAKEVQRAAEAAFEAWFEDARQNHNVYLEFCQDTSINLERRLYLHAEWEQRKDLAREEMVTNASVRQRLYQEIASGDVYLSDSEAGDLLQTSWYWKLFTCRQTPAILQLRMDLIDVMALGWHSLAELQNHWNITVRKNFLATSLDYIKHLRTFSNGFGKPWQEHYWISPRMCAVAALIEAGKNIPADTIIREAAGDSEKTESVLYAFSRVKGTPSRGWVAQLLCIPFEDFPTDILRTYLERIDQLPPGALRKQLRLQVQFALPLGVMSGFSPTVLKNEDSFRARLTEFRKIAREFDLGPIQKVIEVIDFALSFRVGQSAETKTLMGVRNHLLAWVSAFTAENPVFARRTNYQAFLENALLVLLHRVFIQVGRNIAKRIEKISGYEVWIDVDNDLSGSWGQITLTHLRSFLSGNKPNNQPEATAETASAMTASFSRMSMVMRQELRLSMSLQTLDTMLLEGSYSLEEFINRLLTLNALVPHELAHQVVEYGILTPRVRGSGRVPGRLKFFDKQDVSGQYKEVITDRVGLALARRYGVFSPARSRKERTNEYAHSQYHIAKMIFEMKISGRHDCNNVYLLRVAAHCAYLAAEIEDESLRNKLQTLSLQILGYFAKQDNKVKAEEANRIFDYFVKVFIQTKVSRLKREKS